MADASSQQHRAAAVDAAPPKLNLTLEIWRGLEGLEDLQEHWQRLASRCGDHYLHLPAWYRQKLAHMERDQAACFFLTYFSDSCLVAVIPLKWQRQSVRLGKVSLPLRLWQLYLPDEMGVCDATIDPAFRRPQLFQRISKDLNKLGLPWDCLSLRHLPDSSHLLALCRQQSAWQVAVKTSHSSKYLPTHQPYEELMEQRFSKKFRRNLKRKQNKLARMGEVAYEFVTDADQLAQAMIDFEAVEASGWKGEVGSALTHQADKKRMYEKLVASLAIHGQAGVHLLKLDGRAIAGQVAVYTGGTVYLLKIGYDEGFNSVSPGFLLVNELLNRACSDNRLDRLSFVTGVGWMDVWKPAAETVYCAYHFRHPVLNSAANLALQLSERKKSTAAVNGRESARQ